MKPDKSQNHVVLRPDQKGLVFFSDSKQALKVFDALIKRLGEKGPPYNYALVPQTNMFFPDNLEKGSAQHAVFLFMLCLWMRGGVESNTATLFLRDMYEEHPEAFNPELYRGSSDEETESQIIMISAILKKFKLGQRVEENAPGWVYNMRKLAVHWQSDPRLIMSDKPEFEILAKRLIRDKKMSIRNSDHDRPEGFMFFREKMTSMIAYFLMDAGLVPIFYTPVPVDFHVLRLLVANQIIRIKGENRGDAIGVDFLSNKVLKLARQITEWYCIKKRVSPVALCDALWLLSRSLCRNNPGNSGYAANSRRFLRNQVKRALENAHPELSFETRIALSEVEADSDDLDEMKKQIENEGRSRYRGLKWHTDEIWRNPNNRQRFHKSCGVCPLNQTCAYNISAGAYYILGKLLPERLRLIPDDDQVHFLNHPAFQGTFRGLIDPEVRFAQIFLD